MKYYKQKSEENCGILLTILVLIYSMVLYEFIALSIL